MAVVVGNVCFIAGAWHYLQQLAAVPIAAAAYPPEAILEVTARARLEVAAGGQWHVVGG
jgi:hypothetical protein